jgi:hypothetical protein
VGATVAQANGTVHVTIKKITRRFFTYVLTCAQGLGPSACEDLRWELAKLGHLKFSHNLRKASKLRKQTFNADLWRVHVHRKTGEVNKRKVMD